MYRIEALRDFDLIEYIPLQQGLRHYSEEQDRKYKNSLSIFHYNKD